jgi:hypothetical protein
MIAISMVVLVAVLEFSTRDGFADQPITVTPESETAQVWDGAQGTPPPVGTKITMSNWQQYKNYMALGMAKMFQNQADGDTCLNCRVPPDVELDVGPMIPTPLPKLYVTNGEKYGSQIKLVPWPTGGIEIQNYTAGLPFAQITEPNIGAKLLYNVYYRFVPTFQLIQHAPIILQNHLGNRYFESTIQMLTMLQTNSDPNYDIKLPGAGDYQQAQWLQQILPEQSKYTTNLKLFYMDPAQTEDTFTYVPAMRRSLRLSAASRCSPVFGTDMLYDDVRQGFNGEPPYFNTTLLGKKTVLMLAHANVHLLKGTESTTSPLLPPPTWWPTPALGKWELRPVYVIDIVRSPEDASSYCYSHRIMYIDQQTFGTWWVDLFDKGQKFWKTEMYPIEPQTLPGTTDLVSTATEPFIFQTRDFQNDHQTNALTAVSQFDTDVPAKYRNTERYATPGGLDQILQ